MRKIKVLAILMLVLFMAGVAFGASPTTLKRNVWNAKQTFNQEAEFNGNVEFDSTVDFGDATVTGTGKISADMVANVVRYVELPLTGFTLETDGGGSTVGTAMVPLSGSTAPGFELDDKMMNIVWADGETSPISCTFVVPGDYASGGAFYVITTESDSTTPNQLDYDVYVNASGSAADSAATNQTPVAVAGDTSTPFRDTLSVSTDFSSLAASSVVTFRSWRDDTADGTGDLELKHVLFFYNATQ